MPALLKPRTMVAAVRPIDPHRLAHRTADRHHKPSSRYSSGPPRARPKLDMPIMDGGDKIGIADAAVYETWGHGKLFTRMDYGMPIHQNTLNSNKMDAYGARIILAPWIWDVRAHYYWRQVVHISNQDGELVDVAQHDPSGHGTPDAPGRNYYDWRLDIDPGQKSDWYYDSREQRAIASHQNGKYWETRGKQVKSDRFGLIEDNPIQPIHLLAETGPWESFPEIRKHPVTEMPLASEVNTRVNLRFATSLVAVSDPAQESGGKVVFKCTWGFQIRSDESWALFPFRQVALP